MRLLAALALAFIPAASFAADLPQSKDGIFQQVLPYQVGPADLPRCHTLFPPVLAWLPWPCDPYGLTSGTTDRSNPHVPGTRPTPPPPPPPPPCDPGSKGDHTGHEGEHHDHETRGR